MASSDKYDRQTRLWGAHGQRALGEARICLLNAGPTGTESLKNLVLPGCGFVTVVDGEKVTEGDVGNNFFVSRADIGSPRAEVTLSHLLEMNPDVSGEARCVDPSDLIGGEPGFFEGFSLVIASQLQRDALLSLSAVLWSMNVPLIAVRSYGLVGSMRIARPVHVCFEAKEAQAVADLRIANPFPALQAFADAVDLKSCDDETHRHLPYPVLLVKLMGEYAAEHGGQPKTFAQRKAFAKWVGTQRRDITTDEGVPIWEENFDEAVANASKASLPTPLRPDVADVLADAKLDALESTDDDFWFLARALRDFRAAEGKGESLPVSASLPDMTATTALYLRLNEAYKLQATLDRAAFCAHLERAREAAGCDEKRPVSEGVIDRFLASCQSIKVMRYRPIAMELSARAAEDGAAAAAADAAAADGEAEAQGQYTSAVKEAVAELQMMGETNVSMCPALWAVMLRAADDFQCATGRFPGAGASPDLTADAAEVAKYAAVHAAGYGVADHVTEEHAQEITRYGACEPHVVAATMGAVVAQEAVKLLTQQYVPVDNTFIFNGIATTAAVATL
ncbi:hypothetical protein FNF28_00949 [Cafeteria roenbergensis]|nr:hypothetical protein FNF28_00949 [Cafeteria roenbergensis]